MKFSFNWPNGFWGEDVLKCWRTTDSGQCLYYKLTSEPKGTKEHLLLSTMIGIGILFQWSIIHWSVHMAERWAVSTPDFRSQGRGFESCWKWDSSWTLMVLHCTEPFMLTLPSSRYYWNTVERDIKSLTHPSIHYTFIGWVWGAPAVHLYQVHVRDHSPYPLGIL